MPSVLSEGAAAAAGVEGTPKTFSRGTRQDRLPHRVGADAHSAREVR